MANIHTPIPSIKLNDGTSIPMLGFGNGTIWYKKEGEETDIDEECIKTLTKAIGMGYTHLDAAEMYRNETEMGRAIKASNVPRGNIFVTTKVLTSIDDIPNAIRTSLKKLQLDYVDLYLIHRPSFAKGDPTVLQAAWKAMQQVQTEGLTRSIGVSEFMPEHLAPLIETGVVPAINQIQYHPFMVTSRAELLALHKKHSIITEAYGPLTPLKNRVADKEDFYNYIDGLAKKYAVTNGEILLRWCVDQDIVAVTTSRQEQRMSDYTRSMLIKLTPVEIKNITEKAAA